MKANATIAGLLHEAAETHHANWLLDHSELPNLLGARRVRSQLVHALVALDRAYVGASPSELWEDR